MDQAKHLTKVERNITVHDNLRCISSYFLIENSSVYTLVPIFHMFPTRISHQFNCNDTLSYIAFFLCVNVWCGFNRNFKY